MTRVTTLVLVAAVGAVAVAGCRPGSAGPAPLDTRNETCRFCRMSVSDVRFAAQIVAPGAEPVFFDDLGCLSSFLKSTTSLQADAVAYVADHRTKEWVPAVAAVFTRVAGLETPMGSGVIAHKDAGSRDADPAARGGQNVPAGEVAPAIGSKGAGR